MPKGICYNASRQERRKCSLWHAKSPGGRNSGAFLFRCGKVAYSLGWLPPIYLRPAICRCSRRLHLPRQRVRKTKIYSWWHAKSPGGRNSGAILFRCGKVAYSLGWLPPIYLRPAICRCSRRLHLPRQRVRKTKIYSWWHTPFLYLYRGGSVAHYTIVAEMPQEAISPCLLSKP